MSKIVNGKERHMILIEGNIGSGKSFLGRSLASNDKFFFIEEPVKQWKDSYPDNMLDLFYKDPWRWGFTFQLAAFNERAKTWDEILSMTDHSMVLCERSIYTDRYVFSKIVHKLGYMTDTEYQLYCNTWDFLHNNWCDEPDVIVYLRVPADECYESIKHRGRFEESEISLDYIKELEERHDEWLLDNPITIVTGRNDDVSRMIRDMIRR